MEINPLYYGLPTRIKLVELGSNQLGIRKVIKSRIIQKDAAKIVEMAKQIKSEHPNLEITLICTSNICSKSITLLESKGINIQCCE
jgi:predicted Fe-Mo cluster-binding NifX family protein